MERPRIVLDTNVLFTALRSRQGASFELLRQFRAGRFRIAISVPLLLEYEDVLKRDPQALPVPGEKIDAILDQLCRVADEFDIHFLWRPILRDSGDDHILELAVASRSVAVVTYNKRDFVGLDRFGIQVLTPKDFLRQLRINP